MTIGCSADSFQQGVNVSLSRKAVCFWINSLLVDFRSVDIAESPRLPHYICLEKVSSKYDSAPSVDRITS